MNESGKKKVLFLCTGNSCRSQMAEALTNRLRGDVLEAYSAGIAPKGIDPRARKALGAIDIDISGHTSKGIEDLRGIRFDYVVTLCGHADETCPVFPQGVLKMHKAFQDPPKLAAESRTEDEAMAHYLRVRDEIQSFVKEMPGSLDPACEV